MRITRNTLRSKTRRLTRLCTALVCAAVASVSLAVLPGAGTAAAAPDKILFERNLDIYSMNPDGTGETLLTMYGTDPAYSPDGTKIVYHCGDNDQNNAICVMNADGTDVQAITDNVYDDFDPVWSPDGTRIAFTRMEPGGSRIFVVNPDGTGAAPLFGDVSADARQHSPAFSPDGTRVAYSEGGDWGAPSTVYVRAADGSSGAVAITNTDTADNPSFSPDGAHVVYDTGNSIRIALVDPPVDAEGNRVISTQTFYSGGDYNLDPSYSPDGAKIAFYYERVDTQTDEFGNVERTYVRGIYVRDVQGGAMSALLAKDGGDPAWKINSTVPEPTPTPTPDPTPTPTPDPTPTPTPDPTPTPAPSCAAEVTSLVHRRIDGSTTGRGVKQAHTIRVTNTSGQSLHGLVHFVFEGLPASVQDGDPRSNFFYTRCVEPVGTAYKTVGIGREDFVWAPGQTITLRVEFFNPDHERLAYNLRVFTGPNWP